MEVTAFSAADTVAERLEALQARPAPLRTLSLGLLYSPGLVLGIASVAGGPRGSGACACSSRWLAAARFSIPTPAPLRSVVDGTLLLPLLAVLAGIVLFTSPCCLPLLPGYLSYISALPVSELSRAEARATTVRAAVLFVAGFTLLGASFGFFGSLLLRDLPLIVRLAGWASSSWAWR